VDEHYAIKRRVRRAIVEHVRWNPEVSDTAAGIVQWWLPPAGFEQAVDVIDEVLDELVDAGILRKRRFPDGGVVYSAVRTNDGAPPATKE
jgi:hypothetical protein